MKKNSQVCDVIGYNIENITNWIWSFIQRG